MCIRLKGTNLGTLLIRYDKFKVGFRGGLLFSKSTVFSLIDLIFFRLLSVGGHVPLNYGQTGPCPPGYSNPHPGIYPTQQNGEFESQIDNRVTDTGYNLVSLNQIIGVNIKKIVKPHSNVENLSKIHVGGVLISPR